MFLPPTWWSSPFFLRWREGSTRESKDRRAQFGQLLEHPGLQLPLPTVSSLLVTLRCQSGSVRKVEGRFKPGFISINSSCPFRCHKGSVRAVSTLWEATTCWPVALHNSVRTLSPLRHHKGSVLVVLFRQQGQDVSPSDAAQLQVGFVTGSIRKQIPDCSLYKTRYIRVSIK